MKRTKADISAFSFPEAVREWIGGSVVYDSSCSPGARVYFLEKGGGFYLKTAPAGTLKTEADMTAFFHRHGLSAEVLYYGTEADKDFLITSRIPGEDCTFPDYLASPERLCDTTAELLRSLHETDPSGCPVPDLLESYIASVRKAQGTQFCRPDLTAGLWEFASFEEARDIALEGLPSLKQDAVIHGDYCMPNILLDNWRFSGFIDLGSGGLSDGHIDVFWGVWSLSLNLKTTKWAGRFLDAYGRDRIDTEKLRSVAAMEMITY